jgi:hypothetical protein
VDPESRIYLDNAATSFPKPEPVVRAVVEYMTLCGVAAGRGSSRRATELDGQITACRGTLARLWNADSPAGSAKELLKLTDNGQHLSAEGYARTASQLVSALTPGKAKELKTGDVESLRQLIRKKNELFFHRHRPQNVTYLFLFRKHEQGNNAVDIPKFDPLVKGLEEQIHAPVD